MTARKKIAHQYAVSAPKNDVMSANAPNYSSAFPSEWTLTDEDNHTPIPTRSCSQSLPSCNDTTSTLLTQSSLEPIPTKISLSGYLDYFPESWTLPDSESSPPPSPPCDVDTSRRKAGIQSEPDILQARRDPTLFSRPLNRFQERSVSISDPSGWFVLQRQRQRDKLSNSFLGQQRNTRNWLAGFQELQIAKSRPIPLRQKFKAGASDEATRTDLEIKLQNMLWSE
jgi:hypothetical protein